MRQGHAAWQGGSDWPLFERSTTLTMRPQVDACESLHCSRLHHLYEVPGIAHLNMFNTTVEPPSRPWHTRASDRQRRRHPRQQGGLDKRSESLGTVLPPARYLTMSGCVGVVVSVAAVRPARHTV